MLACIYKAQRSSFKCASLQGSFQRSVQVADAFPPWTELRFQSEKLCLSRKPGCPGLWHKQLNEIHSKQGLDRLVTAVAYCALQFSTVVLVLCVPNEVISRFEICEPSVPVICSSLSGKELSVQNCS